MEWWQGSQYQATITTRVWMENRKWLMHGKWKMIDKWKPMMSYLVANTKLPSPQGYGWKMKNDWWMEANHELPGSQHQATITTRVSMENGKWLMYGIQSQLPVPGNVTYLVNCGWRCSTSTNECHCWRAGLCCTNVCTCSNNEEHWKYG